MPLDLKAGTIQPTPVTDPQRTNSLSTQDTLQRRHALFGTLSGLLALRANRPLRLAGATHVIFEPLDFIARLVALVPRPRVNLTRYHGILAPHSQYRSVVIPARRGKGRKAKPQEERPDQTPAERRASITWARRLKRVFKIDIGRSRTSCPSRHRHIRVH
jgi:hypothetical protein